MKTVSLILIFIISLTLGGCEFFSNNNSSNPVNSKPTERKGILKGDVQMVITVLNDYGYQNGQAVYIEEVDGLKIELFGFSKYIPEQKATVYSFADSTRTGKGKFSFPVILNKSYAINCKVGDSIMLAFEPWTFSSSTDTTLFTLYMETLYNYDKKIFNLQQPYPNPVKDSINLDMTASVSGKCEISVFDLRGNRVVYLLNEVIPAGRSVIKKALTLDKAGIYYLLAKFPNNLRSYAAFYYQKN